jgi:hypothetical protein
MAFILLKRSRNTRSYYLVENYRDGEGRSRRRTLCYLGREQDGTDTLEKALAHWQEAGDRLKRELRAAKGERKPVVRRRLRAVEARIGVISGHVARQSTLAAAAEARRREREQEAEESAHWQAIERLKGHPTPENAKAAKRAYLWLAKRHHPDQGGSHQAFLRLKDAYDRASAVWRRLAA